MVYNLLIWNIVNVDESIISGYINYDNVNVVKQLNGIGQVEDVEELVKTSGWDYIVIFVNGDTDIISSIMESLEVDEERILYPLEGKTGNGNLYKYIFQDYFTRWISFAREKVGKDYITVTTKDNITYLSEACDNTLMYTMWSTKTNWSEDEICSYFRLADKYYHYSNEKKLFFDIGANIGTTSIYVKKIIKPDIHIIAFEPSPEIYKLLHINMILNDIYADEYTLVNMGLADKEEERMMKIHSSNLGQSTFIDSGENENDSSVMARNISFDEYINREKIDIDNIGYIWIDIEGFEGLFLEGAFDTLSKIDVPICMEITPHLQKKIGTYEMFMKKIERLYSHYIVIQDENVLHNIGELRNLNKQADIFFIK